MAEAAPVFQELERWRQQDPQAFDQLTAEPGVAEASVVQVARFLRAHGGPRRALIAIRRERAQLVHLWASVALNRDAAQSAAGGAEVTAAGPAAGSHGLREPLVAELLDALRKGTVGPTDTDTPAYAAEWQEALRR